MTQSWPLSPASRGRGKSPSSVCQAAFPSKQHLPSQQHRASLGSTAPFQHKSCTIPSSQPMQYSEFIFTPFPVFSLISSTCSSPCLEPQSAALSKNVLVYPPSPVTPGHAPCSLAYSQSIEQPAKPRHKPSWMKKSLAI